MWDVHLRIDDVKDGYSHWNVCGVCQSHASKYWKLDVQIMFESVIFPLEIDTNWIRLNQKQWTQEFIRTVNHQSLWNGRVVSGFIQTNIGISWFYICFWSPTVCEALERPTTEIQYAEKHRCRNVDSGEIHRATFQKYRTDEVFMGNFSEFSEKSILSNLIIFNQFNPILIILIFTFTVNIQFTNSNQKTSKVKTVITVEEMKTIKLNSGILWGNCYQVIRALKICSPNWMLRFA